MAWTFYNANGEAPTSLGDVTIGDISIAGGTDVSDDLVDTDEIALYDASASTNRKSDLSRLKTYIGSLGIAKAWLSWDGDSSPAAKRESFNVGDLDDDGAGLYGINWLVDMDGTNYPSIGMAGADSYMAAKNTTTPFPAGSAEVTVTDHQGGVVDRDALCLVAFGEQV